ncbi:hypothetical protein KFE94_16780 [bacterium SCSIO 12643]|nr:hypothetical protein KFE94_16780 [bacterium SCSIO 12643]
MKNLLVGFILINICSCVLTDSNAIIEKEKLDCNLIHLKDNSINTEMLSCYDYDIRIRDEQINFILSNDDKLVYILNSNIINDCIEVIPIFDLENADSTFLHFGSSCFETRSVMKSMVSNIDSTNGDRIYTVLLELSELDLEVGQEYPKKIRKFWYSLNEGIIKVEKNDIEADYLLWPF